MSSTLTDTLKISPYQYKNGYSCYVLHSGSKPTKETILIEASKLETISARLNARKERGG